MRGVRAVKRTSKGLLVEFPSSVATGHVSLWALNVVGPELRRRSASLARVSQVVGSGPCGVCGHVGEFTRTSRRLRESHKCAKCDANLRYRLQAYALSATEGHPDLPLRDALTVGAFTGKVIFEPGIVGPFRPLLRELPGYTNSAFWPDVSPGATRDGVRCEDLHRLTFEDQSIDLVISSDIFEHVRHPWVAFGEIFRVLRPGGWHVFTVPLAWPLTPCTQSRVDTSTDDDVFIEPAQYHASPTDAQGSLVYTDFGMDMPDRLRELGFATVTHHGFQNAVTFASRRPGPKAVPPATPASIRTAGASPHDAEGR